MTNLEKMLNQVTWDNSHSSVWTEIVSRFGQADYDDVDKRAKHEATLKDEWEAYQYGRDRIKKYPAIGDQLDALYKAGVFPADMEAEIKKVKDDNPKPTE